MKCCAAFRPLVLWLAFILPALFLAPLSRAGDTKAQVSPLDALTARAIGPANMSGRITAVAVVEKTPDILYVGAATGGVWKSTDAGKNWTSIFDQAGSLCIGDVAVSQANPDIVWVGTGEANVLRSVSAGDGIYKSTDGGKTWKSMGLTDSKHIARIVIHPKNPEIVYVAVQGHGFGPNKERGLFKTTDGGKSWTNTKYINDKTGFIDLAMDPADPEILYAAAYTMERDAFSGTTPRLQWSAESGLFKTIDGAKTWTKMTEGLPKRPIGRAGLTVCAKDSKVVYALIQTDRTGAGGGKGKGKEDEEGEQPGKGGKGGKDDPDSGGIYRSEDKGKSWTRVNGLNTQFPFYFGQIRVDPTDEQRVYVLGVPISHSTDGGKTFSTLQAKGVHVDHHALWINPKNPSHLVLGNDGGVYITRDRGTKWDHVQNLPLGQFYAVGVDMRKPYFVYGGLQDNGCWGGPSATRNADGILLNDWYRMLGADGFYCQPDPNDPTTVYCESQTGGISRVTVKGTKATPKSIKPGGGKGGGGYRFNWNSPILISPHDSSSVYFGGNLLFMSTNRGDKWDTVSPDLSTGGKAADTGHTITTIAESPLQKGWLLAGTDDGRVHLSQNGGKDWTELSAKIPGPKERWITRVEWSHHAADTAYVSVDRHRNDDWKPYLFKTTDAGATWQSVVGDLPRDGNIHVVRESSKNPNLLFVGTEWGLFGTLDGGKHWQHLKKGIPPKVLIHDLVIHPRDRELVVGTHGRSIYILDIASLEELTPAVLAQDVHLCAVKPTVAIEKKNPGKPIYAGQNPPEGVIVSYYFKTPPAQPATLTMLDIKGKQLTEYPAAKSAGLHQLEWNPPGAGVYTAQLRIGRRVWTRQIEVVGP